MSTTGDLPDRPEGRTYGVPARRARIIELLTEAYALDDLDQAEFELRVERAENARTIEELDALIFDFPEHVVSDSTARAIGRSTLPVSLTREEVDREVARLDGMSAPSRFSLIGDTRIQLHPEDPPVVRAVSIIGDSKVDLCDLAGGSGVVLIKVAAGIGDTKIVVPRGTPVEVRMMTLLGDQKRTRRGGSLMKRLGKKLGVVEDTDDDRPPNPGPTVVVNGFRLIGDTIIVEE